MSPIWGISSSFPLANHFDLPGSQFTFGISQDSSMYVHASLSQDGFYHIWVERPLALLPIWPTRSLSVYVWCRRSSDFRNEKCLGRARPLAIVVLLFLFLEKSTRNESPGEIYLGEPIYLLPQSKHQSEKLSVVSNSLRPHELHSPWNSPGQKTGVGRLSLLQGIFPTQE